MSVWTHSGATSAHSWAITPLSTSSVWIHLKVTGRNSWRLSRDVVIDSTSFFRRRSEDARKRAAATLPVVETGVAPMESEPELSTRLPAASVVVPDLCCVAVTLPVVVTEVAERLI